MNPLATLRARNADRAVDISDAPEELQALAAQTLALGQAKARAMRRTFSGVMPRRTAARLYAQAAPARAKAAQEARS